MTQKIRISHIQLMKQQGAKIVTLTAYDYPTARLLDEAGVDIILVGDSLGNTILGYPDTIPVTLDAMIHHCAAVSRGAHHSLLIGDMPFLTYKTSPEQALDNTARMIQLGGMEGVKFEGGEEVAPIVRKVVSAGIPVMGHIGLLPQSVHALSGYRVQGKDEASAKRLLDGAIALEQAGAFCIVLEAIPPDLAKHITQSVAIPTIGIGSGKFCDGQVLVLADLLGLTFTDPPKFAKQYANLREIISAAVSRFADDVKSARYPDDEHHY
jgi:3-methyl-2-oxobutanoate hydroxymethyltransferase